MIQVRSVHLHNVSSPMDNILAVLITEPAQTRTLNETKQMCRSMAAVGRPTRIFK
jgi:hypothetical protein